MIVSKEPLIGRALTVEDIFNTNEEERRRYEHRERELRDYHNAMSYHKEIGKAEGKAEGLAEGLAEGKAEGLAEGKAEGKLETQLETASKMLDRKMPLKLISDITGLGIEKIKTLKVV